MPIKKPSTLNPWDYGRKEDGKRSEHAEQTSVFMWTRMAETMGIIAAGTRESYSVPGYAASLLAQYNDKVPELHWLYAVHNQGHGDVIRGARARNEGMKEGVFDLCLPIARRNFHGLYIEMKVPEKVHLEVDALSDEQKLFRQHCFAERYMPYIAFSWLQAVSQLLWYAEREE